MMRVCFAATLLLSAMAQEVPDTGHCTSAHCCAPIVQGMCKGNTHAADGTILAEGDEVECTGQKMDIANKDETEGTDVATCCTDVPKCSTTTCPTGWVADGDAADTLIAGETAAMEIGADYAAVGADVDTCCNLIDILDSTAEIAAANAVVADAGDAAGLTLAAVGALTCDTGFHGTVVPTVTAGEVLALTGCTANPTCADTTCPTGWVADGDAATEAIAGETAAMDIDANYAAVGADVDTCCDLIDILDSTAEIAAANAVAATDAAGLTLAAVGALTCAADYTGTVVPTVTAGEVLALTGCEPITGYCTGNLHGDFECGEGSFVLPELEYTCAVATGDGTCTRTTTELSSIDTIEGVAIGFPVTFADDGMGCTASDGDTTCTLTIAEAACPAPTTEDKTSGAHVAAPFGIALAAAILLQ